MLPVWGTLAVAWQYIFFLPGPRPLKPLLSGTLLVVVAISAGKSVAKHQLALIRVSAPRVPWPHNSHFIGQDWLQGAGALVTNRITYPGLPFWALHIQSATPTPPPSRRASQSPIQTLAQAQSPRVLCDAWTSLYQKGKNWFVLVQSLWTKKTYLPPRSPIYCGKMGQGNRRETLPFWRDENRWHSVVTALELLQPFWAHISRGPFPKPGECSLRGPSTVQDSPWLLGFLPFPRLNHMEIHP